METMRCRAKDLLEKKFGIAKVDSGFKSEGPGQSVLNPGYFKPQEGTAVVAAVKSMDSCTDPGFSSSDVRAKTHGEGVLRSNLRDVGTIPEKVTHNSSSLGREVGSLISSLPPLDCWRCLHCVQQDVLHQLGWKKGDCSGSNFGKYSGNF